MGRLFLPVLGLWAAGLLGITAAGFLGASLPFLAVLLYALLVAVDLLRQSRTRRLMQGSAPGLTPLGLLLVALIALAQLGLVLLLQESAVVAAMVLLWSGLLLLNG